MSNSDSVKTASGGTADTVQDLQAKLLSTLVNNKSGMLSGRELYIQYGESKKSALKAAILDLQKRDLISVKGNLETPFGVFESVPIQR